MLHQCPAATSGNIPKCVQVLKPTGHLSHIMNHGTDREAIEDMKKAHAEGQGPGVSFTLVQPNGHQLSEVLELIAAGQVKLEVAKVG